MDIRMGAEWGGMKLEMNLKLDFSICRKCKLPDQHAKVMDGLPHTSLHRTIVMLSVTAWSEHRRNAR